MTLTGSMSPLAAHRIEARMRQLPLYTSRLPLGRVIAHGQSYSAWYCHKAEQIGSRLILSGTRSARVIGDALTVGEIYDIIHDGIYSEDRRPALQTIWLQHYDGHYQVMATAVRLIEAGQQINAVYLGFGERHDP